MDTTTRWRFRLAALLTAASVLSFILCTAGCDSGGGATGTAAPTLPDNRVGLAEIQGEWLYIRAEDGEPFSGDCITIEGDQVTQFTEKCRGENLLQDSDDITTNGDTVVLRFSLPLAVEGEAQPLILEVTATLAREGDIFTGTDVRVPPAEWGEPFETQLALRRGDPLDL